MPKPVLQAMVLADHVYRDAGSGKFLIIGTFGNITLQQFRRQGGAQSAPPFGNSEIEGEAEVVPGTAVSQSGTPYLYLALTGIHGSTTIRLRYVNLSDASVLIEGQFDLESASPVALAEFSLPLPSLTRPPGRYSLDLLHDGEILGSWRVTIELKAPPAEQSI
jgi:hypothetical protein